MRLHMSFFFCTFVPAKVLAMEDRHDEIVNISN